MLKFISVQFFLLFTISTVWGAGYDETLARYKIWPMASAAYSDNPAQCITDNFADAKVGDIVSIFMKEPLQFVGQYTYQCDIVKDDTCSGFVAVSNSDKAIILSFR